MIDSEELIRKIINTPSEVALSVVKDTYDYTEVLTLLADRQQEIINIIDLLIMEGEVK